MLLPEHSRPVLITDAGFRAPWCRTVERRGWQRITRLRHRTLVKPVEIPDRVDQWVTCRALYALTLVGTARDLGMFDVVRNEPIQPRSVLQANPSRGRRHTTLKRERRRGQQSRQHAQPEAEPRLLMARKETAYLSAGGWRSIVGGCRSSRGSAI